MITKEMIDVCNAIASDFNGENFGTARIVSLVGSERLTSVILLAMINKVRAKCGRVEGVFFQWMKKPYDINDIKCPMIGMLDVADDDLGFMEDLIREVRLSARILFFSTNEELSLREEEGVLASKFEINSKRYLTIKR